MTRVTLLFYQLLKITSAYLITKAGQQCNMPFIVAFSLLTSDKTDIKELSLDLDHVAES